MIEKETGGDLEKLFIEILKVNLVNPVRIWLETCIWGNSAVDIWSCLYIPVFDVYKHGHE
jgi:hypothetical protein